MNGIQIAHLGSYKQPFYQQCYSHYDMLFIVNPKSQLQNMIKLIYFNKFPFQAENEAKLKSLSVDLIFGRPNQRVEDWLDELQMFQSKFPEVPHLSLYQLTLERGKQVFQPIVILFKIRIDMLRVFNSRFCTRYSTLERCNSRQIDASRRGHRGRHVRRHGSNPGAVQF